MLWHISIILKWKLNSSTRCYVNILNEQSYKPLSHRSLEPAEWPMANALIQTVSSRGVPICISIINFLPWEASAYVELSGARVLDDVRMSDGRCVTPACLSVTRHVCPRPNMSACPVKYKASTFSMFIMIHAFILSMPQCVCLYLIPWIMGWAT